MICPVQKRCGGCPTLPLTRQTELAAKMARVESAFKQVGLVDLGSCIVGDKRTGYRNRLRMKVDGGKVDLFNQAKEQGCIALRPELWDAITSLRQTTRNYPILLEDVHHVEVRVCDSEQVGLSIAVENSSINNSPISNSLTNNSSDNKDPYRTNLQSELGAHWQLADRSASVQPRLRYEIAAQVDNLVPIDSFVQVNSEVNRLLVAYIRDIVAAQSADSFIDLFCGAGNLTLPLLEDGLVGTAIERKGSGPKALIEQTQRHNINVLTGDVHDRLGDLPSADVVISNPARSGIKTNHDTIASLASAVMICVGCEPEALASDVSKLTKHGLKVRDIQTFDMFPGTNHIETVVTLQR